MTLPTGGARRHLDLLTNSEVSCFRRCAREHRYRYVLNMRPVAPPRAPALGSLCHVGREALWKGLRDGAGLNPDLATTAILDAAQGESAALDAFDTLTAVELVRGYAMRWAGDEERLRILEVEVEFRAPLVNPATGFKSHTYDVGGKIDGIVLRDGRPFLSELKTTSEDISPGADYWSRLRLDSQVSTYYVGARSLGFAVEGVLYDVIRKPGLRPLQVNSRRQVAETPEEYAARVREDIAENPDRYYARGEVVRLEAEQKEAASSLWATAKTIMFLAAEDWAPQNPDACKQWGRSCAYLPVCSGQADIDDPTRYRRADRKHEELAPHQGESGEEAA